MILEKTTKFRGVYHVLNGRLDPLNGITPNELNIKYNVDDKKFDVLKKGETIYVKQDNSNILSWKTALSNFKNLPCNAIIISDHYFYKQTKRSRKCNRLMCMRFD